MGIRENDLFERDPSDAIAPIAVAWFFYREENDDQPALSLSQCSGHDAVSG